MHAKLPDQDQRSKYAESAAYWFLRLNGFLTIENFVLHRQAGDPATGMRTDADIVGLRFPHRFEEGLQGKLEDHDAFQGLTRPLLIFAEVKASGVCRLNGPWSKVQSRNLDIALKAIGAFKVGEVSQVADALYKAGGFSNELIDVKMAGFASDIDEHKLCAYPLALMFRWTDVFDFIYKRFNDHRTTKIDHGTWREDGKALWEVSKKSKVNAKTTFLQKISGDMQI